MTAMRLLIDERKTTFDNRKDAFVWI